MSSASGRASQETVERLTATMVTSLTTKTIDPSTTHLLVLVSTTSGSRKQLSQQERAIAMLEALEIPFELLNGAMPEFRERRNELFEMSGIRGNYPQFFKISPPQQQQQQEGEKEEEEDQTGSVMVEFVGNYDAIETINENSNMDAKDLTEKDLTWDRLMGTNNKYDKKARNVDVDLGAASAHSTGGDDGGIYGALDDDSENNSDEDGGGGNLYADL